MVSSIRSEVGTRGLSGGQFGSGDSSSFFATDLVTLAFDLMGIVCCGNARDPRTSRSRVLMAGN